MGGCWVRVGVRVCVEGGEGKGFAPAGKGVGQGEKGEAGWWRLGAAGVLCGMRASHPSHSHATPCILRTACLPTQYSPLLQPRSPRLKKGAFLRQEACGSTRHTHRCPSCDMFGVFHRCAGSELPASRSRFWARLCCSRGLRARVGRCGGSGSVLHRQQHPLAGRSAPVRELRRSSPWRQGGADDFICHTEKKILGTSP